MHHVRLSIKITRHSKRQKILFEETEKTSEPDMAAMLESSEWKFKPTIITVLKTLMDKVGNLQEQMGNISRGDGNPNKEPK